MTTLVCSTCVIVDLSISKIFHKKGKTNDERLHLYNNIVLFNHHYSQLKINRAIQDAGLELFVQSLPQGLDTRIDENGKNISDGEKQRIGLARLLLSNKQIMLFDEPTANLDHQTALDIYYPDLMRSLNYRRFLLFLKVFLIICFRCK